MPVLVGITLVAATVASLGAPLLPMVTETFSVSVAAAQWTLTSALLTGAVAAPILGRVGDGPYRRETILGALVVVAVGGVIAGLAGSLPLMIAGRTLQGIGLGLAPIAMAAARHDLPSERSPAVIGLLSVSSITGAGFSFPVSGLLADELGLGSAFLFSSALSLVALVFAYFYVPSSRGSNDVPLDLPGAALCGLGLVALLLGVAQAGESGWTSSAVLGLFAIAAVVLAFWARQQMRKSEPLVDLRQLTNRAVFGANGAALLLAISVYVFVICVTVFVQVPPAEGGLGSSVLVASCSLVPLSVCSFAGSRVMWRLQPWLGPRALMLAGTGLIALAGIFFAIEHDSIVLCFAVMGIIGVGFGFTFASLPSLVAGAVAKRDAGSALGFHQVVRGVGFAVGAALGASVLAAHTVAAGVPSEAGFLVAAWVGSGVCLVAFAWSALMIPRRLE